MTLREVLAMATDAGREETEAAVITSSHVPAVPRSGEYVVVARRYRPQSFQDLVGQSTVSQALCNALTTDRVGHAYLFTGARGVGKTSTARILAKALNCVAGPTTKPCDECDICQQITAGSDVDVLEIDGASNRGIDEIRQLRSNVGIRPSRARFKIYIIDEVHMLTKEAFNALLKTLEEPPDHVKFVFCTTEPGKIPVTVLSRCQRFDFAPVMTAQIVERLSYIVQQEGVEADSAALELLARRAAGSMRDSQSLLEQLLSFVSEPITVDHVHAMLGTARDERLQAILAAVNARDAAGALAGLDLALREGVDAGQLGEQLVGSLRDMMAALVGCAGDLLLQHAPSQLDELRAAAETWGLPGLLAAVQILDQALARMRQSVHGRVLLEIALVRIAQLENLQALADLVLQVQQGRLDAVGASPPRSGPSQAARSAAASSSASPASSSAAASGRVLGSDATATSSTDAAGASAKKKIADLPVAPSSDVRDSAHERPAAASVALPADSHADRQLDASQQRPRTTASVLPEQPSRSATVATHARTDDAGARFADGGASANRSERSAESGDETSRDGEAGGEGACEPDGQRVEHTPAQQPRMDDLHAEGGGAEVGVESESLGQGDGAIWSDVDCERIWKSALNELNDMTADYAGTASGIASSGPNRLVVRFQQMYNSSKTFCERPERRQVLEQAVSRIAGKTIRLDFELTQGDVPQAAPVATAATRQQQRQQVTRHPFVERALELFAGEVMQVDVKNQQAKE
jgi:DNA polymerase III subunit gamma/tau